MATMESMLGGFKSDLGKISGEIKSLQDQSVGMSVKLRNRKAAEARLGTFVETLTVPPELIRAVVEDDVSEDYLKHLVELDRRLAHIDAAVDAKDAAAVADVQPELARLRAAAAKRLATSSCKSSTRFGSPRRTFRSSSRTCCCGSSTS